MRRNRFTVGYKKPPREYQFAKGRSGNPNGRPRRISTRDSDIISDVLREPIFIKEGDKQIKIPLRMQIERALVAAALRGDVRAGRMLEKYRAIDFTFNPQKIPRVIVKDYSRCEQKTLL